VTLLDQLFVRRTRRPASWVALAAGTAIAAGLEGVRLAFRNLTLFRPAREPLISWNPADYDLDPAMVDEIRFLTPDKLLLHAWYCRAKEPIASVLFCHGNSGNITRSAPSLHKLVDAGISVFTFDYRGFGQSQGRPTVRGLVKDAVAAAKEHDALRGELPSILYGYSLGGAVALQLTQLHTFDGMILQSTFTNLRHMARVRFPKLPVHLIAGREYDSLARIRDVELPLILVHGTDDRTVPTWMGEQLFEACRSGRELVLVDGGEHTNLYAIAPERVVESIRRLALRLRHEPRRASLVSAGDRVRDENPVRRFLQRWLRDQGAVS
jgi:uncharacterized protein